MRTFLRSHSGAVHRQPLTGPAGDPVARTVAGTPLVDPPVGPPQHVVPVQPVEPVAVAPMAPAAVAETDHVARRDVLVHEGPGRVLSTLLCVAAGAALIVLGLVVLVRGDLEGSWREPVVDVAGMEHTPLMGAIDIGVGVLLLIAAVATSSARFAAGVVLAIAGAVLWIEPDALHDELAAPWWFGAIAVGVGVLIALLAFAEGDRRSVVRHTVADRSADVW